jgi:hypothetical protein
MELESLFSIVSTMAFFSWVILWVFYQKKKIYAYLFSFVMVTLAMIYAFFIVKGINLADFEKFQTLSGVKELFGSDEAVLAGWIHYLIFDLFVGMWIAKEAFKLEISRWVLLPFLLFTFMMGPIGLLMFLIFLTIQKRKYPLDPFEAYFQQRKV